LQYRYELEKAQDEADPEMAEEIRPLTKRGDLQDNSSG